MQKRKRVFLALNLHMRREKPLNPCFWNKTSEQPKHQILQIREQVSFNFSEIWNFLLSDQKCLKENLLILNLQQQWRWVYPALQEASWTPAKCACRVWMTDPWSSWCWVVHWRFPSATSTHPGAIASVSSSMFSPGSCSQVPQNACKTAQVSCARKRLPWAGLGVSLRLGEPGGGHYWWSGHFLNFFHPQESRWPWERPCPFCNVWHQWGVAALHSQLSPICHNKQDMEGVP